jgi:hypothetical protein
MMTMTETTEDSTEAHWGADGDGPLRSQRDAVKVLSDLLAAGAAEGLPAIQWRMGRTGTVVGECLLDDAQDSPDERQRAFTAWLAAVARYAAAAPDDEGRTTGRFEDRLRAVWRHSLILGVVSVVLSVAVWHDEDGDREPSRRLPGPAVEDSDGLNLRPPVVATDAESLLRALNEYRTWAGDVSYRDMERGCNRLRSSSTLHQVLTGTAMPTQVDVKAIILGCGGTEDDVRRYVSAWRQIRSPRTDPAARAVRSALRTERHRWSRSRPPAATGSRTWPCASRLLRSDCRSPRCP